MADSNIRALAAQTLTPVIANGQSLSTLFEPALEKCDDRDRGLMQQLCYGTLRNYHQLLCITDALLDKPLRKKDTDVLCLLLLGLYQIVHLRTPDHAAISETVSACRTLKKPWASKLVNGVLRRFLRERTSLEQTLGDNPQYRFSHPLWFIKAVSTAWPENYPSLLAANNTQPPVCLRVNAQQVSRTDYLQLLTQENTAAQAIATVPYGIRLETPTDIRQLPGFAEGYFSVQDEAAQLCAGLLDLQPGQRVLDACSAPGGKACQILEHPAVIEQLFCVEQDGARMQRIVENLRRLQLTSRATLVKSDATQIAQWWDGKPFDRILLDAPCSATGVIRRHPDIKLLRRPDDIDKLAAIQCQLLAALWQTLAPGGLLLYATCSVLPQENEHIVQRFVKQQTDAIHLSIKADWGLERAYGRQLLPQLNGHDGFYYARIVKKGKDSATEPS